MQLPKYPLFHTFLLQPVKVMIGLCWKLYFVVSVFACFAQCKLHQFGNNGHLAWPPYVQGMRQKSAWELSGSGKMWKYWDTFFYSVHQWCPPPPCQWVLFAGDLKTVKLTAMLLQTRRCTQPSSCTSRFTRRFPPRCLKSRWNHSMPCSTNTPTTTQQRIDDREMAN